MLLFLLPSSSHSAVKLALSLLVTDPQGVKKADISKYFPEGLLLVFELPAEAV